MRNFTLTFNHKLNNNGFIIEAWDMADARAIAKEYIEEGFLVDAVKTESGVYPL